MILHKGIWHGSTGRQAHGKVPREGIAANQQRRMFLFGYSSIFEVFFNGIGGTGVDSPSLHPAEPSFSVGVIRLFFGDAARLG
jgi:hypothetical protein